MEPLSDDTSSSAFGDLESETNTAISVKKKRISVAESEVDEATASILEQEQALSDGQDLLDSATATLDNLESMCVKGEETFEERKKKREEEIEALKDALAILEDSDCYLRLGDGGTKTARFGSRTCFLR